VENRPEAVPGLESEPRWQLAQRIIASPPFQRSSQLRAFLAYVVEKTLLNRQEEVTEQLIGSRVLGRRPDYDPNEDNIVRVQARHLRERLQEYFEGEGRAETVLLEIPKGSYVPVFRPRPPEVSGAALARRRLGVWLPWTLAGVLAAACVWLAVGGSQGQSPLLRQLPWSRVFDARHDTWIVVADSCFALMQDIEQRSFGLKEYLNPSQLPRAGLSGLVLTRQFTSFADVILASRFYEIAGPYRDRVQIRYARNLHLRDFKAGHYILLGSSRSNPWVELFDERRNFQAGYDPESRRPLFRNRHPQPGERPVYLTEGSGGRTGETWGLVALLPQQERNGCVLIVEGTNMEGTEAAGEFLTNPGSLELLRRGLPPDAEYFEVLLRSTAMAGTPRNTGIAALRVIR
jgi:hypothetical protein